MSIFANRFGFVGLQRSVNNVTISLKNPIPTYIFCVPIALVLFAYLIKGSEERGRIFLSLAGKFLASVKFTPIFP